MKISKSDAGLCFRRQGRAKDVAIAGVLALVGCAGLARAQELRSEVVSAAEVATGGVRPVAGAGASIQGTITDGSEAAVPDAVVTLEVNGSGETRTVRARSDGSFLVAEVKPGAYQVTVAREGFEPWHGTATVGQADQLVMPEIVMKVSAVSSSVEVRASEHEIAEAQLSLEEKQRVLGVFPNFYASYAPDAAPLTSGEKMRLAMRFVADPVAFGMAGVVAGSEQRANTFPAYGRGTMGYVKRYGAAYTDGMTSTMLGQALLPMLFHQDPRYFVKGTGSTPSRALYAIASMVICKGDNRHWQLNYSNLLGNFASAGLSNVYYPTASRGAGLVVGNALTATALGAVGGLFQEFVLHRMTPHVPDYGTAGE